MNLILVVTLPPSQDGVINREKVYLVECVDFTDFGALSEATVGYL